MVARDQAAAAHSEVFPDAMDKSGPTPDNRDPDFARFATGRWLPPEIM